MFIQIIAYVLTSLILLICYFLKRILDTSDKRLNAHSRRMDTMEDYNRSQFEKINGGIADSRLEIIKGLNEVNLKITTHIAAK